MGTRRTVRHFSDRPVAREVIDQCLLTAGGAPSGANLQPWHFVVVGDPAVRRRIREAAEEEEREFYAHRAPQEWLDALAALGTDANKPFLGHPAADAMVPDITKKPLSEIATFL
jgi:iodotyrosine deiodinase